MQLKIYLPQEILVDQRIAKLVAPSEHGQFGILPNHIDCLAILVPGILTYFTLQQEEMFVAVDEGLLVKCGAEVMISTRHAVQGHELADLKHQVNQRFLMMDEQERRMRSALAQLEAGLARYFIQSEWRP